MNSTLHCSHVVVSFAFVFVATAADAKKAIKEVHGRKLKDSTLTVAMAYKKDRTNAISGEGTLAFFSTFYFFMKVMNLINGMVSATDWET